MGHWELMGVVAPEPLPTYPGGFPDDVVARLRAATGLRVLRQPARPTAWRSWRTSAPTTCAPAT